MTTPPTETDDEAVFSGRLNHPDGDRCDLEYCQRCGLAFDPAEQGYLVSNIDVGADAEGETARLFREDAENVGEWLGFEEEDLGAWCDSCSWPLQSKRTQHPWEGA